jgi:DNA-binding NarL/FixJ family response regulator
MTLQDLRAEFTRRYPTLVRMGMAHLHRDFGREAREEMTQHALVHTWRWVVNLYVSGRITEDNAWNRIKNCLHYSIHQTLEGRRIPEVEGKRGVNRADVFDRLKREDSDPDFDRAFISDQTSVPDQVAWRQDFPVFLETLTARQRLIARAMMDGYTTTELAHIFGVTPGAISQFRTRFKQLFDKFFGE